jgi:hypothetical protein
MASLKLLLLDNSSTHSIPPWCEGTMWELEAGGLLFVALKCQTQM